LNDNYLMQHKPRLIRKLDSEMNIKIALDLAAFLAGLALSIEEISNVR